jgi:hypothetical protein
MAFYRYLIYLVVALLVGSAGYYFHTRGVPDLIVNGNDGRGNGVSALEVFSGVYLCDTSSGCENPTKLILQQDTTLDITSSVDGQEASLGQGVWNISGNGSLALILQSGSNEVGPFPAYIFARKISSMQLSEFSSKRKLFTGMENPVFKRVQEASQSTVEN